MAWRQGPAVESRRLNPPPFNVTTRAHNNVRPAAGLHAVPGGDETDALYTLDWSTPTSTPPTPVTYTYPQLQRVQEGSTTYAGDQRVAIVQVNNGSTSYFHQDHLGSTTVLTDGNGAAEEHNSYRPFGALQTHTAFASILPETVEGFSLSVSVYVIQSSPVSPENI